MLVYYTPNVYYPFHCCHQRRKTLGAGGYRSLPLQVGSTVRAPHNYPPIDIHELNQSAKKLQILMKQAQLFVNKITHSPQFAHDLMDAAQKSDQKKVEKLILSTGITVNFKNHFTPDGIKIELNNTDSEGACCSLIVGLKW